MTLRVHYHDVMMDEAKGQQLSNDEHDALDECMSEHSSTRCNNFDPYGL